MSDRTDESGTRHETTAAAKLEHRRQRLRGVGIWLLTLACSLGVMVAVLRVFCGGYVVIPHKARVSGLVEYRRCWDVVNVWPSSLDVRVRRMGCCVVSQVEPERLAFCGRGRVTLTTSGWGQAAGFLHKAAMVTTRRSQQRFHELTLAGVGLASCSWTPDAVLVSATAPSPLSRTVRLTFDSRLDPKSLSFRTTAPGLLAARWEDIPLSDGDGSLFRGVVGITVHDPGKLGENHFIGVIYSGRTLGTVHVVAVP